MQVADQKEQVGCGPRPPSPPFHEQRCLVPAVLSLHGANNMWTGPPQEAITSREYIHPDMNRQLCKTEKGGNEPFAQLPDGVCLAHHPW